MILYRVKRYIHRGYGDRGRIEFDPPSGISSRRLHDTQTMNGHDLHFDRFIAEANIICGLKGKNRSSVISELCERLSKTTPGINADHISKAVIEKEGIIPTVNSNGLAVPHARLENLTDLVVAIGTSPEGVDFNLPGMPLVHAVILILTPKDAPALHLQVLSALTKDFKDADSIEKLASLKSASEVLKFFNETVNAMPEFLTAKDVMQKDVITLRESDTLETVINTFAVKKVMDIPIVDEENDIRGTISLEDILKISLPEHLLWMNDLSPILYFQPFTETIRKDKETNLADIMREDFIAIDEDIPAIQLAKIFVMKNTRQILITKNSKFSGTVNLDTFTTKIFWA